MITWKEEYTMGVPQIDEQHKKLFEIAGRIYELYKDKFSVDKYDKIAELINELKDYTVFHFQSEEAYMASIGYRKMFTHKVEHTDFIEKVNSVNLDLVDEDHDAYLLETLEFVVNWIDKHILEKDKLIVGD